MRILYTLLLVGIAVLEVQSAKNKISKSKVDTRPKFRGNNKQNNMENFTGGMLVDCLDPPQVFQGSVQFSKTTPGSIAKYSCRQGTIATGSNTLICNSNGIWQPQPPDCRVLYLRSNDGKYDPKPYQLYHG